MFREILVPVDGSKLAECALPFALHIAEKADATVHVALVHVPDAYREYFPEHSENLDLEDKRNERQYLDALCAELAPAFKGKLKIHHLEGIVPETLAEEVAERRIDLVVMSAHGWGYLSRAIIGSVSDYLIRHLSVPLLVVHASEAGADVNHGKSFRRVLIPFDGSELAERILVPARTLGDLSKAEYRLLGVVAPRHDLIGSLAQPSQSLHARIMEKRKEEVQAYLETLAQRLRSESVAVDTRVLVNHNVVATILRESETMGCDLIAMSTHGRGGLPRLILGSVADKIVRSARMPVLVYPAPPRVS
jgi:nucleotide-binding universal stress UspA family protein